MDASTTNREQINGNGSHAQAVVGEKGMYLKGAGVTGGEALACSMGNTAPGRKFMGRLFQFIRGAEHAHDRC